MLAQDKKLLHALLLSLLAAYATEPLVLLLPGSLHHTCQLCSCYDDQIDLTHFFGNLYLISMSHVARHKQFASSIYTCF